jgi:hypothetical protein
MKTKEGKVYLVWICSYSEDVVGYSLRSEKKDKKRAGDGANKRYCL